MTVSRSLIMLGTCALVAGTPLAAQDLATPHGKLAPLAVANSGPLTAALHIAPAAAGPHQRRRYVLYGAAVGAIAGGLLLANRVGHEQDPLLVPRHAIVYVGVGAGLGALGGWVLSGVDR